MASFDAGPREHRPFGVRELAAQALDGAAAWERGPEGHYHIRGSDADDV